MSIPAWVEPYLTIPYVRGGRGFNGADCYGLVRLVLGLEAGIWTPAYDWINPKDVAARRAAREAESTPDIWIPVFTEFAECFDVVPMTREHIGIMVSNHYVLHSESPHAGPCCETLTTLKNRLVEPLRRHYSR